MLRLALFLSNRICFLVLGHHFLYNFPNWKGQLTKWTVLNGFYQCDHHFNERKKMKKKNNRNKTKRKTHTAKNKLKICFFFVNNNKYLDMKYLHLFFFLQYNNLNKCSFEWWWEKENEKGNKIRKLTTIISRVFCNNMFPFHIFIYGIWIRVISNDIEYTIIIIIKLSAIKLHKIN